MRTTTVLGESCTDHLGCGQGRTPAEQRDAVIAGFPKARIPFGTHARGLPSISRQTAFCMHGRKFSLCSGAALVPRAFPYSRWGAELNARITPRFFGWLVGPMQVEEATLPDGTTQRSAVKIERCRCVALRAPRVWSSLAADRSSLRCLLRSPGSLLRRNSALRTSGN